VRPASALDDARRELLAAAPGGPYLSGVARLYRLDVMHGKYNVMLGHKVVQA
jgi:hypothetical protein